VGDSIDGIAVELERYNSKKMLRKNNLAKAAAMYASGFFLDVR
jgi:hypothetical protein